MRVLALASISSLLVLFTACSGGGSGGGSSTAAPRQAGSVQVVIDTATGSDALVQFQVVAATLASDTGGSTGNLIASPKMLTLSDPMGQTDGLVLSSVPPGHYSTLRLGLAPQSGVALYPSGVRVPVSTAFELTIPFDEPLMHDGSRQSWVVCGHQGAAPAATATAAFAWSPMLRGRSSASQIAISDLEVVLIEAPGMTVSDPRLPGAPLHLSFSANCEFLDEDGNVIPSREDFLNTSRPADDLRCDGRLGPDGFYDCDRVRRGKGNNRTRLIGRITELVANTENFVMDVIAEARGGSHHMLPQPETALVHTDGARIERSGTRQYVPFSALAVGNLVKVEWARRAPVANGPELIEAYEIEVSPAGGVAMRAEWQGRVDAVDLQMRTITVVPRNNDPIIVNGQVQNSVSVVVDAGVPIERRGQGGGGRALIALDQVVPGRDRIWWRGAVTGPAEVGATWLRVKDQN